LNRQTPSSGRPVGARREEGEAAFGRRHFHIPIIPVILGAVTKKQAQRAGLFEYYISCRTDKFPV